MPDEPPVRRTKVARLLDTRDEILGEPEGAPSFLHALLAQVSLPYLEVEGREYVKRVGRAEIVLLAGRIADPWTNTSVVPGLPYGSRPRLLLLHVCSEAMRTGSRAVDAGATMTGFMRELGLRVTGGKEGTIGRFKDQLARLAATQMQLLWYGDGTADTLNPPRVIERLRLWGQSGDERQGVLWRGEVVLSAEFFASLQAHALPLDPRAVRALQNSARALDVYAWLAHRLPRVRAAAGEAISWLALKEQFGGELTDAKNFKRQMAAALREAVAVYPGARVEPVEGGIRLLPSRPAIPPRAD